VEFRTNGGEPSKDSRFEFSVHLILVHDEMKFAGCRVGFYSGRGIDQGGWVSNSKKMGHSIAGGENKVLVMGLNFRSGSGSISGSHYRKI